MNLQIARFLAWRYIRGVKENANVSTVSKICFLSIFTGTLCLALQIFVSAGFEKALNSRMQSVYPELIIEAPLDQSFDYPTMHKKLLAMQGNEIAKTAPSHSKRIVIHPQESTTPTVVVLKAIDPQEEPLVSSLTEKLPQEETLAGILKNHRIIIGKKLADFYDLKNGDKCTLLFTSDDEFTTESPSFESITATVGAVIETGIMQYDKYTVLCSLTTMKELLHEPDITQIGLKLTAGKHDLEVAKKIQEQFNVEVHSWKTLYPALVSVTKLEKYVMSLLLLLMTLIASANIIALLFMQITRKKADIALLKTLGMDDTTIVHLFTFMGGTIVAIAALTGVCCAILIGLFLQKYPFIELPDAYFCTHLPVHIEGTVALSVFVVVLLLGIVASWLSARFAKSINITQTLRFEG